MNLEQFDVEILEQQLVENRQWTLAFGITPENAKQISQARSPLFYEIYPAVRRLCQDHLQLKLDIPTLLWNLWLPMACELIERHQVHKGLWIQGILGGQGTGKTTLAAVLTLILQHLNYRCLSFSLDDLYKTYADRLALQNQDPRLIWRGPPGTHDIDLGLSLFQQLHQATPETQIPIPQFDKSLHAGQGDRIAPKVVQGVDIVLFEGWFVGLRPIDPDQFNQPPAPIVTVADQAFARDMNQQLRSYQLLWQQLDSLIVLYPVDYRLSLQWRQQAEQQRMAQGGAGMSDEQIHQFVEYFWKALHPELFIPALLRSPGMVDRVIEINPDHSFGRIYEPGS